MGIVTGDYFCASNLGGVGCGAYIVRILLSYAVLVSNHSPNGVEQLSNLSSNVPSKDESVPYGITSRFVKVTLSRICWCKPKKKINNNNIKKVRKLFRKQEMRFLSKGEVP